MLRHNRAVLLLQPGNGTVRLHLHEEVDKRPGIGLHILKQHFFRGSGKGDNRLPRCPTVVLRPQRCLGIDIRVDVYNQNIAHIRQQPVELRRVCICYPQRRLRLREPRHIGGQLPLHGLTRRTFPLRTLHHHNNFVGKTRSPLPHRRRCARDEQHRHHAQADQQRVLFHTRSFFYLTNISLFRQTPVHRSFCCFFAVDNIPHAANMSSPLEALTVHTIPASFRASLKDSIAPIPGLSSDMPGMA